MNATCARLAVVFTLVIASLPLGGCLSPRYWKAPRGVLPPVALDLTAAQPPLALRLNTIIIYQGPGSWKRTAFWDEYVVTLANEGTEPLVLASATVTDPTGAQRAAGADPWALERESKTLEQKYADLGLAFARNIGPGVAIAGAGAWGVANVGVLSSAAAAPATAALIALPVYYVTVWAINSHNKGAIETEFDRRRLVLPLTLAPGETTIGSLFFPMVPSPRALTLRWSSGAAGGELALPLDALRGLHVNPSAAPKPTTNVP